MSIESKINKISEDVINLQKRVNRYIKRTQRNTGIGNQDLFLAITKLEKEISSFILTLDSSNSHINSAISRLEMKKTELLKLRSLLLNYDISDLIVTGEIPYPSLKSFTSLQEHFVQTKQNYSNYLQYKDIYNITVKEKDKYSMKEKISFISRFVNYLDRLRERERSLLISKLYKVHKIPRNYISNKLKNSYTLSIDKDIKDLSLLKEYSSILNTLELENKELLSISNYIDRYQVKEFLKLASELGYDKEKYCLELSNAYNSLSKESSGYKKRGQKLKSLFSTTFIYFNKDNHLTKKEKELFHNLTKVGFTSQLNKEMEELVKEEELLKLFLESTSQKVSPKAIKYVSDNKEEITKALSAEPNINSKIKDLFGNYPYEINSYKRGEFSLIDFPIFSYSNGIKNFFSETLTIISQNKTILEDEKEKRLERERIKEAEEEKRRRKEREEEERRRRRRKEKEERERKRREEEDNSYYSSWSSSSSSWDSSSSSSSSSSSWDSSSSVSSSFSSSFGGSSSW